MAAPDFRLDGKTVVVTGASRGIGAASAVACAQAGAEAVVLLGRSRDDLAAVARRVERCGARAPVASCDLTSLAAIREAFAAVARVDVLVNCAGVNRPEPFADVREETFDRLFALNVRGAFFATQAAVGIMRAGGAGGTIIMMSSQMGHVGAALRSVYCATKHAMEGLTRALAVELAPEGIRVVSVAPTFVRTAMTAPQLDDPALGAELRARSRWGASGRSRRSPARSSTRPRRRRPS